MARNARATCYVMRTLDGEYIEGGVVLAGDGVFRSVLEDAAEQYGFSVDEFDIFTVKESVAAMAAYAASEAPEENPREKGDDDGVEYADPRDYMNGDE